MDRTYQARVATGHKTINMNWLRSKWGSEENNTKMDILTIMENRRSVKMNQLELKPIPINRLMSLSDKEKRLLDLKASGYLNKQIEEVLHRSGSRIKQYIKSILEKLGAKTLYQAVALWGAFQMLMYLSQHKGFNMKSLENWRDAA